MFQFVAEKLLGRAPLRFRSGAREMLDKCAAEGVVALRWSGDGSKAYRDDAKMGSLYIYESQIF
jgi:hypothetical protein